MALHEGLGPVLVATLFKGQLWAIIASHFLFSIAIASTIACQPFAGMQIIATSDIRSTQNFLLPEVVMWMYAYGILTSFAILITLTHTAQHICTI